MKRLALYNATFFALRSITSGILSLLVTLTGCVGLVGVAADRHEDAEKLIDHGVEALRAQRLPEARAFFALAYELAPLAAALDGQGCVALLEGNTELAEQLFRRAYASDTTYDEALAHVGLVLDLTGRQEEALEAYESFIAAQPSEFSSRNNRAALTFDRGESGGSVRDELRKAAILLDGGVVEDNLKVVSGERRGMYVQKSD